MDDSMWHIRRSESALGIEASILIGNRLVDRICVIVYE